MNARNCVRLGSGLFALALIAGCGKVRQQNTLAGLPARTAPSMEPLESLEPAKHAGEGAVQLTRFVPRKGSKVRIEGTSTIHDWQVEGSLIGGFLEVDSGFLVPSGPTAAPGPVLAHAQAFISVRSLRSVEKDGRPYSDKMDEVMYEKFRALEYPKIWFYLRELLLKSAPRTPGGPWVMEATGELAVAGVTNQLSMPVQILPLEENKLKISGATSLKMTDFGIVPPAPKLALGLIKTGDEVKLLFEWMLARPEPLATPSSG